jgi:hypothetical protein
VLDDTYSGGHPFVLNLYDYSQVQAGSINATQSDTVLNVFSAGVRVDPSYYSHVVVQGILVDASGTAHTTVPPAASAGGLISDTSTGTVYAVNAAGNAWVTVSGGAGGGITSSFVFAPGGTAAGNVYTDEALLAAATQALGGGVYDVVYDPSATGGAYTLTTSGNWDMAPGGVLTDLGVGASLTFGSGTQLPFWLPGFRSDSAIQTIIDQDESICIGGASSQGSASMGGQSFIQQTSTRSGAWIDESYSGTAVLILKDQFTFQEEPEATQRLLYNTNAILEDNASIGAGAIDTASCRVYCYSPGASLGEEAYGILTFTGLFIDPSGDGSGPATIGSAIAGNLLSVAATGLLYAARSGQWFPIVQAGRTTLINGVSPSIPVPNLTEGMAITMAHAAINASTSVGVLIAPEANRTYGTPGSFVIQALNPGDATVMAGDQSDVDWAITLVNAT